MKKVAPPSAVSNGRGRNEKIGVRLLSDRKFHQEETRTNPAMGKKEWKKEEGGSGVGRCVCSRLFFQTKARDCSRL